MATTQLWRAKQNIVEGQNSRISGRTSICVLRKQTAFEESSSRLCGWRAEKAKE
jgi:hypothetical protein